MRSQAKGERMCSEKIREVCVRQELPEVRAAVHALVREAFAGAEHRDGTEQDLVDALRRGRSFLPELSLVAEVGGEMAGYVLFTRASVGDHAALVLAPLAVLPRFQRRGVGSALVRKGHEAALRAGFDCVLVLGSPEFYPRFGYVPAHGLGIRTPAGMPEDCFMALRLGETVPPVAGDVRFAEEFGL